LTIIGHGYLEPQQKQFTLCRMWLYHVSHLANAGTPPEGGSMKDSKRKTGVPRIDIGINEKERLQIAEGLKVLLADSYTLYLQTHNFHWNVTGPMFRDLHLMFEEQYTELATAVDLIAERIRSLGVYAPGSYKAYAKLSNIKEVDEVPEATDMLRILTAGHEQVVKTCREVLKPAQKAADESTISLVTDRMLLHEKTAWMLRSLL